MNYVTGESELRKLVIQQGDIDAYAELDIAYLEFPFEEFLPYALIMANKYDYVPAYFEVYWRLWYLYDNPDSLDETSRKMALDYLQKASSKGHRQARETLGQYYMEGIYFKQDTILGKQLIKEAEKPSTQK
jgi:TPR repeat protein